LLSLTYPTTSLQSAGHEMAWSDLLYVAWNNIPCLLWFTDTEY